MSYNTKQQKVITEYLRECKEHVTAAQVAEYLGKNGFKVGIATVYRHLDKLCSCGDINKIIVDNEKSALFCCNCSENDTVFHIKCEICGIIEDMDCKHITDLYDHMKKHHNFAVNPKKTLFYGICGKCSEKNAVAAK